MPKPFECDCEAVNCHHNYIAKEHHFGKNIWVTRKGAVRARLGQRHGAHGAVGRHDGGADDPQDPGGGGWG